MEAIPEFLKNVSDVALIFAVSAFTLVCVIFAVFLKPRLDKFDSLYDQHTKLQTRFETLKVDDNLHDLQVLKTDVALLKAAEEQRDKKVRDAVDAQNKSLRDLEGRISQALKAGDNGNLRMLLALREDQAETAYTLSRIQGGTKEDEARREWIRAKEELARFQEEEEQKQRGSSATA